MNIHTLSTIPGFKNKPPRWKLLRRHFGDDEFPSQVIFDLYGAYLAANVLDHEGPEYSKWKLEMASLTVPIIRDGRLIYALETFRKRLEGLCDDKEYDFAKSLIDERNSVGLDRDLVNLVECVFGSTNSAYNGDFCTFMNLLLNCMFPAGNPSRNISFMQFDWPDTKRLYKIRGRMEEYFRDDFRKQCFPYPTGLNLEDLCQQHGMDSRLIHQSDVMYGMLAKVTEREKVQKFTDVNQELMAALGCEHCNQPLYAAIKCRVCGRKTPIIEPEIKGDNKPDVADDLAFIVRNSITYIKELELERQMALNALLMMRDTYGEANCPACDHADAAIKALRGKK